MLYPLSYTGTIPVAGFEPATTRLTGEVTLVYTTGRNFLADTHPRVRRKGFRPTVGAFRTFRGQACPRHLFFGQGTGGHGRACALRVRTSQFVDCKRTVCQRSIRGQSPLAL